MTPKKMGHWFRLALWCSLLVTMALCLVAEGRIAGCNAGFGCLNPKKATSADNGSIKVSKEVYEGVPSVPRVGWDLVRPDLRVVPSGPDPLHHNGSPKKPQTP